MRQNPDDLGAIDTSEVADGGYPVSKNLLEMTSIFVNTLESMEFTDDA